MLQTTIKTDLSSQQEGALHYKSAIQNTKFKNQELLYLVKSTYQLLMKGTNDPTVLVPILTGIQTLLDNEYKRILQLWKTIAIGLMPYFDHPKEEIRIIVTRTIQTTIGYYGTQVSLQMCSRYFYSTNPAVRVGILKCFSPSLEYNMNDFPILSLLPKLAILIYDNNSSVQKEVLNSLALIYS
ncbi:hypothetical protein M0813_09911 [Anaeramoeba flamelloides]|uniref:Uncharacterized protein n=1 Tax=Anaeramoeba flamelloides TaxID=1746091 RepID=A0ABQ8X534_9EUKA|nr:hypothetical protein M0813_09911 [Anaeramoeba flamelloides]